MTAAAIGLLATGGLVHLAQPILIPLTLACLLTLLLIPAGEWLEQMHLSRRVASGVLVIGVVSVSVVATYHASGPAFRWLDRAPETLRVVGERLRSVRHPVEQVARAAEAVESMTRPSSRGEDGPTVQVDDGPSFSEMLMDGAWRVVTSGVIVAVLVFFLLSSRDLLFRKIIRLLPSTEHRRHGAAAVRGVRRSLSVHLGTLAGVNLALGGAVGVVLWVLDYPSPVLWGLMAGFLNFIPYLGAMVGVTIMVVVGFATFDGLAMPLAGGFAYLLLTSLEGLLVTPVLLGRRLRLNPVAVLVGVIVLGFLWGVPGALLAVPLMVTARVIAEHHPRGRRVVVILGR